MTNLFAASSLMTPLMSSAALRAVFDERARLQRMLDFEVALARAEAALGVIPTRAIEPIAQAARADNFDPEELTAAAVRAGNVATPLVAALTAAVAKTDAEAARHVHWGASNEDLLDTALMLELRAVIDALIGELNPAIEGFAVLTGRYRRTAVVARYGLRHALPMPLGLKLAGYAAALARARERLRRLRKEALALQFGGTAGTLAALGEHGIKVSERLAALIDLPLADAPWHGHSDRLVEIAAGLAILAGTCGKVARDVSLSLQTEVRELVETPRDGHAAPVDQAQGRLADRAAAALAAASIAPSLLAAIVASLGEEHERGFSTRQTQWQAFPALALLAGDALAAVIDIADGFDIDTARLRSNLDATNGLIMAEAVSVALTAKLGKTEAQAIVDAACSRALEQKRALHDVMREDARITSQLTVGELGRLTDHLGYQGVAQSFIERMIGSVQGRGTKRP